MAEQESRWKWPQGVQFRSDYDGLLDIGCCLEILAEQIAENPHVLPSGIGKLLRQEADRMYKIVTELMLEPPANA